MPPQAEQGTWAQEKHEENIDEPKINESSPQEYKWNLVWRNIIILIIGHIGALYGMYIWLFKAKWLTFFAMYVIHCLSGFGITAGSHRLWAHKSYKARLPLRLMLVFFQTFTLQAPVLYFVREHRIHHRYSETDADPHNAKRGFFFSHIGWLIVRKHQEIKAKGQTIDLSDVTSDPLLDFQQRHYLKLALLTCFVIPSYLSTLWGETFWNGFFVLGVFRWIHTLHSTLAVNSVAHLWGNKPYDKNINPVENKIVSLFAVGEGFHNYHHTFPWDYKAAEFGDFPFNLTTNFINLMAKIGWAYDLKTLSPEAIKTRVKRTGDGSHSVWGWNDHNISAEDRTMTTVLNKRKRPIAN